jgi:hypothetical protein
LIRDGDDGGGGGGGGGGGHRGLLFPARSADPKKNKERSERAKRSPTVARGIIR